MLEMKTAINEIEEKRKVKVSIWDRLKNVQRQRNASSSSIMFWMKMLENKFDLVKENDEHDST